MTPDQLTFHRQEIAKLSEYGWIGPTYSPICSPTIMVDKRDDGSGERKMRMVVNYQALNALTIAPDFPRPPIQTILELLGGAKYFSTLDLKAGFHQIRVAKEHRWKTAFRSVLGIFEYRVMPFGLKGAPATFQANINAYLQPLLGKGVIAYLDDVLIYSSDLSEHVSLLRQVLSIFLRHQFYPKFRKCKFARQTITYLGYTVSATGVKPAEDKIEAIRHWPEVLENETQVRQFLGTINYCRMFMGPDYADVARPLVDLTRKDVGFKWTELHTQAVRQLKQHLIDFTTLQVPDTTKPFELYTDASGYAVGAVLEQDPKPIGFLSQVMNPTQQRYSIYDQELLALVTALDKWSHLLRVSKVTAFTDHQALTHLQRLQPSKPLRGRTARWLDFLAEFPDLHITYVQGARNQVGLRNRAAGGLSNTCSHDTPSAPLMLATGEASAASRSRGPPPNYRELAGIRPRRPR
ncbi:OSJNBa0042D13.18 protein, related [Eimeria necatrix]|uniref:OSJNBa0042D13.18 protein, related n=1 Tax=Eimeria necatrix TaxID=51315 RepID=U6MZ59_9EIME|nr:OSJNBa0042D13.18 protein, related [Eimeria necatrix]CDJ67784.1 OSJNBa0042D13.18 protein, related [Eimeria necatrix]